MRTVAKVVVALVVVVVAALAFSVAAVLRVIEDEVCQQLSNNPSLLKRTGPVLSCDRELWASRDAEPGVWIYMVKGENKHALVAARVVDGADASTVVDAVARILGEPTSVVLVGDNPPSVPQPPRPPRPHLPTR